MPDFEKLYLKILFCQNPVSCRPSLNFWLELLFYVIEVFFKRKCEANLSWSVLKIRYGTCMVKEPTHIWNRYSVKCCTCQTAPTSPHCRQPSTNFYGNIDYIIWKGIHLGLNCNYLCYKLKKNCVVEESLQVSLTCLKWWDSTIEKSWFKKFGKKE